MKFIIPKRKHVSGLVALSLGLVVGSAFAADEFPTKPIRIIVPAAVGGGLDTSSRLIAEKMREKLGQPVIIENQPGADTMIGTRAARAAAPDGYTILGQANGFTLLPYVKNDPGFDPMKDFTGLGMLLTASMVLEVGVDSPDRTVQDLVARSKTTKMTYGTGGQATPQQVASALFLRAAGMSGHTEIPFKGSGPTLPEVVAGRVDFTFDGYTGSRSLIQAGKLRPLAVTGTARMTPLPNVPTFQEAGFNFTYKLWNGLVVPAATPKAVVQRLSEALKYALSQKDIIDRWRSEGSDPSFVSPEEMTEYLKNEYANNAKVAADLKFEKQ